MLEDVVPHKRVHVRGVVEPVNTPRGFAHFGSHESISDSCLILYNATSRRIRVPCGQNPGSSTYGTYKWQPVVELGFEFAL